MKKESKFGVRSQRETDAHLRITSMWPPTCSVAELVESLQVDDEQRAAIAALPQGSPEWLAARRGRLTASNFGAAAGRQGRAKQLDLIRHMVWPETAALTGFVQRMAQYGTQHESVARHIYATDRARGNPLYTSPSVRIYETGLLVSVSHGWLGASPDFVVEEPVGARAPPVTPPANIFHEHDPYVIEHECGHHFFLAGADAPPEPGGAVVQGCGEIKCPAAAVKVFYSEKGAQHARYGFPDFYYDQIQGAMAINSWPWCDTVVYTPTRTQVIRFRRNTRYWSTSLFPALEEFYFQMYLPVLERRVAGLLTPDTLTWAGLPAQVSLPPRMWVSPHPIIDDPVPWFTGQRVACSFVILALV